MNTITLFRKFAVLLTVTLMVLSGVYGCGGGSGTTGQTAGQGELSISLTDAPGDFATYTVDVLGLTLTRANGAQVSALPLETRIDFSQYTEMTEFLTSATIPSGIYVSATLTLDYSNADIWVEDDLGNSVQVAASDIVDENGNPVTTMEMTVQLEDRNQLLIAPGIPAHLLLDFDLNATHSVNLDTPQTPVVTVDPFLIADVNRMPLKLHRVRGALETVNLNNSSFSLYLRPFYSPFSGSHRDFGVRNVVTTAATIYEIDGIQHTGQTGLEAMSALNPLTAVIAIGDVKFNPLRFEAREVYTGSSVPGGTLDVVRGNVIKRQGDTLTIKGATLIRGESEVVFNDEILVHLGTDTVVTRQLSSDPIGTYGKDDISIGQKVLVFGTLVGGELDASNTGGYVRMLLTTVRGTTTSVDDMNASLTIDLQTIDHRLVNLFDFTGTHSDPNNYQIDTNTLNLTPFTMDTPVKARGFVEPFGAAPPDFNAWTIVNVTDLNALMKVHWEPATNSAFDSVTTEKLTLNLQGSGLFHHVFRGHVATDLTQLAGPVTVAPQSDDRGVFVLKYTDGSKHVFLDYTSFAEALIADLGDNHLVYKLHATGDFEDDTATLTANYIEVKITLNQNPI